MPIYSKPARLAISILIHVADHEVEHFSTVREIASETGVSEPTVAKLLQVLAKEGILESRKGPGGGFRLAHSPADISLLRVVTAVEGGEPLTDCAGGLPNCSELNPCPLHEKWKGVKAELVRFLEGTSLYELLAAARRMGRLARG
ncbi:MAG: RrF2 family transcriptional regulator [Nitrospinota bacterium]